MKVKILSPYLFFFFFFFCAKGLSVILHRAQLECNIHIVKICRGSAIINHLLFVDDSFIFFRENEGEAQHRQHMLNVYVDASGQCINI